MLFHNTAPFMTDAENCLVGIDGDSIYVWDRPLHERFALKCDTDGGECFWYVSEDRSAHCGAGLRSIRVSKEHPLYALPRSGGINRPMSVRHRSFLEATLNTGLDNQISIYHTARHPKGVLCFNRFSLAFPLDGGELESYGVEVITDARDFMK